MLKKSASSRLSRRVQRLKFRSVLPRLFSRCGLAGHALSILRGVLLLFRRAESKFSRIEIVFGSLLVMALHLIIDGYNLLAQTGRIGAGTSLHSEMARESFLRDLAAYRQRKSHAITVVFDGWQQGWGTEQREHRLGLEIIFSRRGEKADQVIQRLAAEFGSACAVVSSDREIIDLAKGAGSLRDEGSGVYRETARGPSSSTAPICTQRTGYG